MGFWSKWFGRGEQPERKRAAVSHTLPPPPAAPSQPLYAPGTRIAYDERLIEHLLTDHRKLLALFTNITQSFAAGDVAHTLTALRQFKSDIQAHLLTEEIRLYVYLQSALTGHRVRHSMMRDMHREMNHIAEAVLNFLGKYEAMDKTPALRHSFAADLGNVGEVLGERIKREETILYPMYMSPADLARMQRDLG